MKILFLQILALLFLALSSCQKEDEQEPELNDSGHPRILLAEGEEAQIRDLIESDETWQKMHFAILEKSNSLLSKPVLEREMVGRRLLGTSREALKRIFYLSYSFRMTEDEKFLKKAEDEMLAVSRFSDWNPSHFLDVAEMTMAVAIGYDWLFDHLSDRTIMEARSAILLKGIEESRKGNHWWLTTSNNWNQVCNGGMIAASIAIAEEDPELAAQTIYRALDGIPHSLVEYGPDGVYPEGSTYWGYGTSYSVVTAAMLESAFGHDFGHLEYPAFKESAVFRKLSVAPSGWYYNFADCGDKRGENGDVVLAWFGTKTGNPEFFEKERFLRSPEEMGELSRLAGAALVWISQFDPTGEEKMPTEWKGEGSNPVVFFTGGEDDPHQYYFGGKGGRGMVNHGNMDGGSFIFELNGVRWVIDPGNQSYHTLEKTGFDLWGRCQDCERWTLLTKNNYGHSTITVNNELHRTEGLVTLLDFKKSPRPEAVFNMTPTLEGQVAEAYRTFIKDSPTSILIQDEIKTSEASEMITWQLMTQAEVEIVPGGAVLHQDGKELKVNNMSHPEYRISVVSLDPPPLELDRQIENLKRLEIRIPAWTVEDGETTIKVRLSGK